MSDLYSIQLLSVLKKNLVIGQVSFPSFWPQSIDIPCMTSVSFVKTTELYEISLVTTNLQTSYDCGILRQDYGIKRGLPMKHKRFADWVTIWVAHLPERTETGGPNYRIGPDSTGRA